MASYGQASEDRDLARLLPPKRALLKTVSLNKGDQTT